MSDEYTIRPLDTIEEYRACVALQHETWGQGFSENVPTAILKVSQIMGGVTAGAFDADDGLVGFVFGMTGVRNGELAHWSDMLAVRKELRDTGLGTRLKAYQRERVMELGVEKMYWTFDPLQSRNAYLNFAKLGIVVREYARDMYGETDSPLHRGIGTDRMVALWLLGTHRVSARLDGRERPPGRDAREGAAVALGARSGASLPSPAEPDVSIENDRVLVAIPPDVGRIMDASMELAVEWRLATRSALTAYLDRGYEVRELLRGEHVSEYLLVRERGDDA